VVVSGRAYDYLKDRAGEHLSVKKIWGYSIVYEDNEVQNFKTLLQNVKGAVTGWPKNVRAYFDVAEKFQPDVVISDFESWSYLFGLRHGVPIVSLDNMQIIDRCTHAPEISEGQAAEMALTKAIVKAKVAGAAHYFITTFFYPPVRKADTSLHPPILRPEILAARPGGGEHLLVYQTSTSNEALPQVLQASGRECRIYGLRRDLKEEVVEGNLRYRPFSESGFIDDLRTAAGVVASAGFTLMGEAVYLGRPMLAVPVRKQFEQLLNALYVRKLDYGEYVEHLTTPAIGAFLERSDAYAASVATHTQDGNTKLTEALDRLLAIVASGERQPG
jgi:uncharacterized protein (TIGR00661 family)